MSTKICCRVLGFRRLITSEHSTHTRRCSTLTPRYFVSVFWFCFRVLGLCRVLSFHRLITSQHSTHKRHDARRPPHGFSFLTFPGTNFPGTIFFGDHFSEDHFSRGPFFRNSKCPVERFYRSAHARYYVRAMSQLYITPRHSSTAGRSTRSTNSE